MLQTDAEVKPLSRNERIALEAQERIKRAVSDLISMGKFPALVGERIEAIREYLKSTPGVSSVSPQTLYKNKHLWHPDYIRGFANPAPDKGLHATHDVSESSRSPEALQDESLQAIDTISFYAPSPDPQGGGAYGEMAVGGSGGLSTGSNPPSGIEFVKQKLAEIRQRTAQRQIDRWWERAEIPPDENLFAQMRLSLEVVSND